MNLYVIIIALFSVAGASVAIYSGINIRKKRRTAAWPNVQASIITAQAPSEATQFLPQVIYGYEVGGKSFQNPVEVPSGESSMPDFAQRFLQQHPVGSTLTVYYDPAQPQVSRLRVGVSREDWLIFSLGIGALLLGVAFILANR